MTGSRNSADPPHRRRGAALAALVLALAVGEPSYAQEQGGATAPPKGLTPPAEGTTPPPPQDATPAADNPAPVQAPAPTPTPTAPAQPRDTKSWDTPEVQSLPAQVGQPMGPAVTVSGLGAVDPSGAGLMEQNDGGFAPTLWSGTTRAVVMERLPLLPDAPNSPAMQTLMHRLLLTSGAPPSGGTRDENPSLLAVRLSKLIANGWIAEAASLAAQAPRGDSLAKEALAESLLLQGKHVEACGEPTALRQSSNEPYWLKMRVLCHLVTNDPTAAQLTLDVMRERQIDDDAFYKLAEQVTQGTPANVAALPKPTGVHVALARLAKAPLPVSVVDEGWVPSYRLFAAASADKELRLSAAERAAAAGLIQIDQLRALYDSEPFTFDQIDDPAEASKKLSPSRANALFYQAIAKRSVPAARASAFSAALQRADAQNKFPLFALVAAEAVTEIQPLPETAWLAPQVTRVLLYTGNDTRAEKWYAALSSGSPSDAPVINALQLHTLLAAPTPERAAKAQGALTWLAQNALKPGGAKAWLSERAAREIPLFEALGYVIPPDAQWALTANTAGVVPTHEQSEALEAMARAAAQGRLGETVLNALIALGKGGPAHAQGRTVSRVVKALTAVGLNEEASAIAIEAVLGTPVGDRS